MKKPRHHVTDHALVRYVERVLGLDVEPLRNEIGRKVDEACEGHDGMSAVIIDGWRHVIRNGSIVAIEPTSEPVLSRVGVGKSTDRS